MSVRLRGLFFQAWTLITLMAFLATSVSGNVARAADPSPDDTLARFCADQLEIAKHFAPLSDAIGFLATVTETFQKERLLWQSAHRTRPDQAISSPLVRPWGSAVSYFWHSTNQFADGEIPDPDSYEPIARRLAALRQLTLGDEVTWLRRTSGTDSPSSLAAELLPELKLKGAARLSNRVRNQARGLGRWIRARTAGFTPVVGIFLLTALVGLFTARESSKIDEANENIIKKKAELSAQIVEERRAYWTTPRRDRELLLLEAKMYEEVGYSGKYYYFLESDLKLVAAAKDPKAKAEIVRRIIKEWDDWVLTINEQKLNRLAEASGRLAESDFANQPFSSGQARKIKAIDNETRAQFLFIVSIIIESLLTLVGVRWFVDGVTNPAMPSVASAAAEAPPHRFTIRAVESFLSKSDLPPHFLAFLRWMMGLHDAGSLPLQTGHFGLSSPTGVHFDIFAQFNRMQGTLDLSMALWKKPLDFVEPGDDPKSRFEQSAGAASPLPKQVSVDITQYWSDLVDRLEKRFSLVSIELNPLRALLSRIQHLQFARGDLVGLEKIMRTCTDDQNATYASCLEKIRCWIDTKPRKP